MDCRGKDSLLNQSLSNEGSAPLSIETVALSVQRVEIIKSYSTLPIRFYSFYSIYVSVVLLIQLWDSFLSQQHGKQGIARVKN